MNYRPNQIQQIVDKFRITAVCNVSLLGKCVQFICQEIVECKDNKMKERRSLHKHWEFGSNLK
jgi:hypothetical protein